MFFCCCCWGICYNKAVEQGIAHGQLPINEYFWLNHRKVLTINQGDFFFQRNFENCVVVSVFEILLRVSEGKTFKAAIESILPKRIEKTTAVKESDDEVDEEKTSVNSDQDDENTS